MQIAYTLKDHRSSLFILTLPPQIIKILWTIHINFSRRCNESI